MVLIIKGFRWMGFELIEVGWLEIGLVDFRILLMDCCEWIKWSFWWGMYGSGLMIR